RGFVHRAGIYGCVVLIVDRCAGNGLALSVQIIGAGPADVESAEIAQLEVVAGVPVDAVYLQHALIEGAAVIDPQDQRLSLRVNRGSWILDQPLDRSLEWRTSRGQQIVCATRRAGACRAQPIGGNEIGEGTQIGVVE